MSWLREAMTHRSVLAEFEPGACHENGGMPSYERLEFLGDAVLGLCVSHRLMARAQDLAEGDLSRVRAGVVNEEHLAQVAQDLNLGSCMFLGKGEQRGRGRQRSSILADTLEALIGAIFSDGGFQAADRIVGQLFDVTLQPERLHAVQLDFKTMLQEWTQEHMRATPTYEVIATTGPDHAKTFEVEVVIDGQGYGRGDGASKKKASQNAAQVAFEALVVNRRRGRSDLTTKERPS